MKETSKYSKLDYAIAVDYLATSPYCDYSALKFIRDEHGIEPVIGLAGLLYLTEKIGTFRFAETKRLIMHSLDLSINAAESIKYYAASFPLDATFVNLYFDDILLRDVPTETRPNIVYSGCPCRSMPLDIAEEVGEKCIEFGQHHTYIVPALCKRGSVKDMNELPFTQDEVVYVVSEGGAVQVVVWDRDAETNYNPQHMYFKNMADAKTFAAWKETN